MLATLYISAKRQTVIRGTCLLMSICKIAFRTSLCALMCTKLKICVVHKKSVIQSKQSAHLVYDEE